MTETIETNSIFLCTNRTQYYWGWVGSTYKPKTYTNKDLYTRQLIEFRPKSEMKSKKNENNSYFFQSFIFQSTYLVPKFMIKTVKDKHMDFV